MRPMTVSRLSVFAAAAFAAVLLIAGAPARGEEARISPTPTKNHKSAPTGVPLPAGKPVILVVKNADATAEEFESSALKIEKIIPGGQQGTVRLRPLAVGSYDFIGEFHSDTANGKVIAE